VIAMTVTLVFVAWLVVGIAFGWVFGRFQSVNR
jgi:predicted cobalt transporter CbtA